MSNKSKLIVYISSLVILNLFYTVTFPLFNTARCDWSRCIEPSKTSIRDLNIIYIIFSLILIVLIIKTIINIINNRKTK